MRRPHPAHAEHPLPVALPATCARRLRAHELLARLEHERHAAQRLATTSFIGIVRRPERRDRRSSARASRRALEDHEVRRDPSAGCCAGGKIAQLARLDRDAARVQAEAARRSQQLVRRHAVATTAEARAHLVDRQRACRDNASTEARLAAPQSVGVSCGTNGTVARACGLVVDLAAMCHPSADRAVAVGHARAARDRPTA